VQKVFHLHTKDKAGNQRRLLIVDEHSSHVNLKFIKWANRHRILIIVTVRHMYAAAAAAAPNYGGPTSTTSKGNARGEQAMYIERTTTLLKALFFFP
jgi:hypothetical protein